MRDLLKRLDIRVSLAYLLAASLWIFIFDTLITDLLAGYQLLIQPYHTIKDIGFVVVTTIVLFIFVSDMLRQRMRVEDNLNEQIQRQAETEDSLQKMARLYRLLSTCNQIMIRTDDEITLLQSLCTLLVNDGGYRLAWVGYGETDAAKTVRVVASAGDDTSYLHELKITWDDSATGQGPTGTAIRTGKPGITRFILTDPNYALWRDEALKRGYGSSIALPLIVKGQVIGALSVYADREDAFEANETALLSELANNLGYGIEALRTSSENQRIRIELEQERDISPVGIVLLSKDGNIEYANARAEQILGLTRAAMKEQSYNAPTWRITDYEGAPFPGDQLPFSRVIATGQPIYGVQHAIEWPDGKRILLEINAGPQFASDGSIHQIIAVLNDVTTFYRYEHLLHESEERYRLLVQAAPEGIFVQTQGKFAYLNPAAMHLFGADSIDQLLGQSVLDRFHPEYHERVKARMKRVNIDRTTVPPVEEVCLHLDGTPIHVEVSAAPITFEGQHGALAFIHDIEVRKKTENALRESEQRYRLLINSLKDYAVFSLDNEGYITGWNIGAERIIGYRAHEIIGTHFSILYPKEAIDNDIPAKLIELAREKGEWRDEDWRVRKDGSRFWAEVYIVAVRDDSGQIRGFSRVMRDLTESKQTESRIRYLADLIESMSDAIISIDNDHTIRSWNKGAENLYGWKPEEVIGKKLAAVLETAYINETAEGVIASFREQGKWQGEVIQKHRDGSAIDILSAVSITHDSSGNPIGMVGINRDISERKRTEKSLQLYNQRLTTLRHIDSDIIRAQSPDAITESVLRDIPLLIPCDTASVTLFEEADATVYKASALTGARFQTQKHSPLSDHPHQEVLRSGSIIIITDLQQEQGVISEFSRQALQDGARSMLSAPLSTQDKLIGHLTLCSRTPDAFNEEHAQIAREIANQLAIAFNNTHLLQTIQTKNQQLKNLSARLVEAQEIERGNIARELHDEVGQTLTALSLMLDMQRRQQDNGVRVPDLNEAQTLVNDLTKRIRELSLDLRPSMLDDLGLIPTLVWYLGRYQQQTGIAVDFKYNDVMRRFSSLIETTVYRIIQEALTNVARHAHVKHASVRMWTTETHIHAQIEDPGIGFDLDSTQTLNQTGGLLGLRERAAIAGGVCEIESSIGAGTIITAHIPL